MVYIHSDTDRKLPHNFDAACALYGALEQGEDIRLTTYDEVASGKFDLLLEKKLFVGSVDFMTEVFKRAGKSVATLNNPYQQSTITSIKDARKEVESGQPLFIKPLQTKLFTGMVFTKADLSQISKYPADTEVIISKPFTAPILSEWRCYVHNQKIVDSRNYAGDFRVVPDFALADQQVAVLDEYPVAYTFDVGILENGEQVVIELNDMWAIGNYGIENPIYYQLLFDRYIEIMST